MPTRRSSGPLALALSAIFAGAAGASPPLAEEPLTVIDWLGQTQSQVLPDTVLLEPPTAGSAARPEISVTPLEALLPPIGLVTPSATGLPIDLWRGSAPQDIARLLRDVPVHNSPAMQSLLFTVILSESRPLPGGDDAILLARLDRLIDLGAIDPAQALAEQAGPSETRARFDRWFDSTLLTGDEDRACAALTAAPYLAPDYSARIFCAARRGDWPTAALMLESAHALELLDPPALALLDRFLNPDIFEGAAPLPAPDNPDPLTFRLFETIGERQPTAPLPRAFAAADLRDIAGWKAQLEAAERLTRVGALNPNQLLGLFTERKPAASGGIWDRVRALQTFETALRGNRSDPGTSTALDDALQSAWEAAQASRIEVAFADLFADDLGRARLQGEAAELAWRIRLLARSYELAAHNPPSRSAEDLFLAALAQGRPAEVQPPSDLSASIATGFAADAEMPVSIARLLDNGQLGEAILQTIELFAHGADGNLGDLSAALVALRAMGLEDTARRAALQLLLLDRH
ncbi:MULTISPECIES: hypothetical protein [Rhodobacterales]|uniref:hypothetical protein n=1 Tax=Rhodobacterales TaxID=204455 RepID=UPI00237F54B6|nr:hypothetical protein [Phaeobacter gallaeciensis]MDE4139182.1 hypothetical protein [Phaeobacter gallaeciensis]MDE4147760.1 hypothetical protein [Phaeobacter gallaeciensis]MDE4151978.1 hypothetical protein [Phaeobacter gallaeciensis]MDE4227238.1 hypothetical protein [Phaeobacter gallaeciensis]MDE4256442.1 hypothetical protein [Phaeobacter gallaeciensis]